MSQLLLEIGDPNSWNPLWNTTVNSVSAPGGKYYYPIPDIEVPLLLTRRVLAVYADSETARPTWRSAGFLNQKVRTGLIVGGQTDAVFNGSQRVWLKNITVLIIPTVKRQPEYSITFAIHPWHEDISLQLWEYTGTRIDSTDELIIEEVIRRLLNIQSKVDEIATYNN